MRNKNMLIKYLNMLKYFYLKYLHQVDAPFRIICGVHRLHNLGMF